jgi:hypothetical protein
MTPDSDMTVLLPLKQSPVPLAQFTDCLLDTLMDHLCDKCPVSSFCDGAPTSQLTQLQACIGGKKPKTILEMVPPYSDYEFMEP